MATIPTQRIISTGNTANDGTGDTLRDAAIKINDNFNDVWFQQYVGKNEWPGRKFTVANSTVAASPGYVNLDPSSFAAGNITSTSFIRISWKDAEGKGVYPGMNKNSESPYENKSFSTTLELYQYDNSVDRDGINNWVLRGLYTGRVQFETVYTGNPSTATASDFPKANDCWKFSWDSTVFSTNTTISVDDSCYIKINGLW